MKFSQKMPLYLYYTMVQKSKKWPKTQIKGGPALRQDPLEAILVIFGRRALIIFVWKLLEKNENYTTFVRMRSGDHLGNAKMSKKGASLRRIYLFFISCDRQKRFSQNERRRADQQKLLQIF